MDNQNQPEQKEKPFQIIFRYGGDEYIVTPLEIDPRLARKAFQLDKQTGEKQVYEVLVTATAASCTCRGFQFRGKCKHVLMLTNAKMLD